MTHTKLFIVFAVASQLLFANNGNGGGGGTDTIKEVRAWFLGPEKIIHACMTVSPDFGVSADKIREEIYSSYTTWGTYIQEKKVKWIVGDLPAPTSHIKVQEKCSGTEDLLFYFGTEDETVKKLKSHYQKPYGISEQLSWDGKKMWSKGLIWISPPNAIEKGIPNWTLPNTLRGILLHEIGHSYGNGHINGTIMSEDFGMNIKYQDETGKWNPLLTKIDQWRELFVCKECSANYKANLLYTGKGKNYLNKALEVLTGKPVETNDVSSSFAMKVGEHDLPYGEISYITPDTSRVYKIKTTTQVGISYVNRQSFQSEYMNEQLMITSSPGTWGYSYFGTLSNGEKSWPIIVNRNLWQRIDIVLLETGQQLFYSGVELKL